MVCTFLVKLNLWVIATVSCRMNAEWCMPAAPRALIAQMDHNPEYDSGYEDEMVGVPQVELGKDPGTMEGAKYRVKEG